MLSDQSNQAEASVEPIESTGVEEVAPSSRFQSMSTNWSREPNMPRVGWLLSRLQ